VDIGAERWIAVKHVKEQTCTSEKGEGVRCSSSRKFLGTRSGRGVNKQLEEDGPMGIQTMASSCQKSDKRVRRRSLADPLRRRHCGF
jgi:hypothetical protein